MCAYGVVLGACALGASIVLADWSAPVNGPTTCTSGNPGCDAPLNVSSTAQTKSGSLTLSSGSMTAPQYCIGASCISAWPSGGGGGTIGGTGGASYIPMWSSGTTLTNSPVYVSGGALVDTSGPYTTYLGSGGYGLNTTGQVYAASFSESGTPAHFFGGIYETYASGTCYVPNSFTGGCWCPVGYPYSNDLYLFGSNANGTFHMYFCYLL